MFYNSFILLLLLGATSNAISENNDEDTLVASATLRKKEQVDSFVLVNPKQVHVLENTIRKFLSRLAEPVKNPIILRSRSSKEGVLQRTIRAISETIRRKFMQFAEACGLSSTVRFYKRSQKNDTISEDWFSESLLQSSFVMRDFSSMMQEVSTSVNSYFTRRNITFQEVKQLNRQSRGFQFLGAINDVTEFSEKLSYCLQQTEDKKYDGKSFSFNRAVLTISKAPPGVALKNLRSSFDSTKFDPSSIDYATSKQLHAFLCLSIANKGTYYSDCIQELQNLDRCMFSYKQRSDNKVNDQAISSKPWLRAIQHLSDCKVYLNDNDQAYVSCKMNRKIPKKVNQRVRYIYERILNRPISRRSLLYRAANELGTILSRSSWGTQFVNELCQYFAIYEEGHRRLERLSADAKTSRTAFAKYKKVATAMNVYRKGVLYRTFHAINNLHRTTLDFERFLINGIKLALNETWQSHIKMLSCMTEWMVKLLELFSGDHMNGKWQDKDLLFPTTPSPLVMESDESTAWYSDESFKHYDEYNGLQNSLVSRTRNDIRKEVDTSLENLMSSMNRVSKYRTVHNRSMLASMANNLLLVAMFMETIGFVSTLFCLGQSDKSDRNFSESNNDWNVGRKRRSPVSMNYQEADSELYSDFLKAIRDNVTIHFDTERKWLFYKDFFENNSYTLDGMIEIISKNEGSGVKINK